MKRRFFNKRKIFALSFALCLSPLTSCSAFFGGDEFAITNVEQTTDEETGDITITITFNDESIAPLTFTIPKVTNGTDGNGIANITHKLDGDNVVLTITYTDTTMQPTVVSVPVVKGEAGKGIQNVNLGQDENGNTTIQFEYTDGTTSQLITIPKGIDGKDGVGIANIDVQKTSSGINIVTISFTDESIEDVTFSINDGISIDTVTYDEENSNDDVYVLLITFSDGTFTSVELPRPQSSVWHSGGSAPDSEIGKTGDFYINMTNGYIYEKISDVSWRYLFSIKGTGSSEEINYFNVFFHFRDNEYAEGITGGSAQIVSVEEGNTVNLNAIPTPQKDGYEFVGWFASEDESNVNVGQFTNLTVVTSELHLYARRDKVIS